MSSRTFVCATLLAGLSPVCVADTVRVANVAELEEAVWNASSGDVIQLTNTALRVYDLSTTTHKGTPGHLYAANKITLLGATDNPEDIVLRGSGNRIIYLHASGNSIRNLTFENGDCSTYVKQTTSEPYDYPYGGAIMCREKNGGIVSNCVFRNNQAAAAGGAAGAYGSNACGASFFDCVFTNNTVTADNAWGGALYAAADVKGCFFGDNHLTSSGSTGGAIFNARSIIDCTFTNNSAIKGGGVIYYQKNTSTPNPVVSGCTFVDNHSGDKGSVIKAGSDEGWGAAILVSNCVFRGNGPLANTTLYGTVTKLYNVVGCAFVSNTAAYAGVAYDCTLIGCAILGNAATTRAGAAELSTLKGCLIAENRSSGDAGAALQSVLVNCTNRANVAASYTELCRSCRAEGCVFEDVGASTKSSFGSSSFDRCRISSTNGYLFTECVALTNCLIAACTNCWMFSKASSGVRLVNCTVVGNNFSAFKTGDKCAGDAIVQNTLFYGNTLSKGAAKYDLDATVTNVVSTFDHCIFSTPNDDYAPGTDNLNYYGNPSFRPGFVGADVSPTDPYALKRTSPAVKKEGLVGDWMATATDIRGEGYPRLRDGKVNIGCYQCWLDPTGLLLLFR